MHVNRPYLHSEAGIMSKKGHLFCSKPFEWFEVTQLNGRGGVYLCCPSWLDTPIGNLQYQSVSEIWNGEQAQRIRRSILDGSFEYCNRSRCSFLQNESGPVKRVEDVEDRDLRTAIEKKLTTLPYGPKQIVCTYDRSCNLSCPSCRTEVIVESESKQDILNIQQRIQNEALKDASYLHISGSGDPFGSPFFRKWLQTMKRQDMPNLERIHLQTNGMLWTSKMWGTIAGEIQQLVRSAEISIDAATPETYSMNRRGGDFEQLLENLEFISKLRRTGPLESVKISMVVQENNFMEMPDFARLGRRLDFDTVYFGQLVNWGTFSEEEFADRAIHLPGHPRHAEFVSLLQSEIFDDPLVDLGNLTETRNPARDPSANSFRRLARRMWARVQTRS
jgi:pyruvate-formate lyase-activating enzyme